jgi:hypothetical protein
MNSAIAIVLVNSGLAFVSAFAGILLTGAFTRYVAGSFATDRTSRIAAFGVAVGYVFGHFSHSGPATIKELPAICTFLGAVAGLVAVWAWLLRKGAGELTDADG